MGLHSSNVRQRKDGSDGGDPVYQEDGSGDRDLREGTYIWGLF